MIFEASKFTECCISDRMHTKRVHFNSSLIHFSSLHCCLQNRTLYDYNIVKTIKHIATLHYQTTFLNIKPSDLHALLHTYPIHYIPPFLSEVIQMKFFQHGTQITNTVGSHTLVLQCSVSTNISWQGHSDANIAIMK